MEKVTVIAKRELLYFGTFGIAAWLCGLIFIDKKARDHSKIVMKNVCEDLKKKKIKLWVFPEGTRRNTGEIHSFKKGAFHTAVQAQIPIIPVIFGSYKHILDSKVKCFGRGEVAITILPEISTEGMTADDVDQLVERTRNQMIEVYDKKSSKRTSRNILVPLENRLSFDQFWSI